MPRALTDAALDEQTATLAAPLSETAKAQASLLVFRAGGERFGLPAAAVQRIFLPAQVRRVPHRNQPAFSGLVAHEGEIVPAGSLTRLLDLPEGGPGPSASARFVLLGPAGRGWAFKVDAVEGLFAVPADSMRAAPWTVARGKGTASRMLAQVEGADVAVLDPEALRAGWEASTA
jgi:chemotaxis signal transduction protein